MDGMKGGLSMNRSSVRSGVAQIGLAPDSHRAI